MDEQTTAVHVPEEVMPQSGSLCGALDDARDIGHDEGDPLVHIDHAQIGKEGGKW